MNSETGEIKELNTEEQSQKLAELEKQKEELEQQIKEAKKWKELPIGEEVDIEGLKFVISHVRIDTQEVILKPVGKMKLKI